MVFELDVVYGRKTNKPRKPHFYDSMNNNSKIYEVCTVAIKSLNRFLSCVVARTIARHSEAKYTEFRCTYIHLTQCIFY